MDDYIMVYLADEPSAAALQAATCFASRNINAT